MMLTLSVEAWMRQRGQGGMGGQRGEQVQG